MKNNIEYKQMLMAALRGYQNWVKKGKPKYKAEQYFYDDYHNHIDEIGENLFGFHIQIDDSPDGDTWVKGEFKLINDVDVEITKEVYDRYS